ncbi:zinc ribbon domain-containing protein [Palleniella muris]|uniref:Zinc ribbon domain-containing protein n=1 Tax=Palleniella muris TaxID=3038145 RepID=A0AC61QMC0_9BACT|nr:zinc ribbon domain-containing protein [Palleniella muris]TGX80448.1 zinc ribbon domain-containing protein [Palleniella muris]
MRKATETILTLVLCALISTLASCYNDKSKVHDAFATADTVLPEDSDMWTRRQDSLTFTSQHHYTNNYNFIVNEDSLVLFTQQPEEIVACEETAGTPWTTERMPSDSTTVYHGERVVVANIRILPQDTIDSVWVQLARDQQTFGWIHESKLLPAVVPDDPISQFISIFSNTHLLWMLIAVGTMVVVYTLRLINRKGAKIVHFNDIPSFYPTALVLIVSFAAMMYASIQLFEPEMWRHFYYHPTLNPFAVPPLLGTFLALVWMLPIVGVATVDDVFHHLSFDDAVLYLCGLAAVCMVDYLIFTLSTLYYIGYILLIAYIFFAIKTFHKHKRLEYYCGKCGKAIRSKGKCPHCGAMNV